MFNNLYEQLEYQIKINAMTMFYGSKLNVFSKYYLITLGGSFDE
jgi:hypothetical protein